MHYKFLAGFNMAILAEKSVTTWTWTHAQNIIVHKLTTKNCRFAREFSPWVRTRKRTHRLDFEQMHKSGTKYIDKNDIILHINSQTKDTNMFTTKSYLCSNGNHLFYTTTQKQTSPATCRILSSSSSENSFSGTVRCKQRVRLAKSGPCNLYWNTVPAQ